MEQVTPIVDGNSGQLIAELYDGDRISIVRGGSLSAYAKMKMQSGRYDIHSGDSFVKVYTDVLAELLKEDLSSAELRIIIAAMHYSKKFGSGSLTFSNYISVSTQTLIKTSNVSKSNGYKAIGLLIGRGILAKKKVNKHDVYFVNPFIFSKGNEIEEELLKMFKSTKWACINK